MEQVWSGPPSTFLAVDMSASGGRDATGECSRSGGRVSCRPRGLAADRVLREHVGGGRPATGADPAGHEEPPAELSKRDRDEAVEAEPRRNHGGRGRVRVGPTDVLLKVVEIAEAELPEDGANAGNPPDARV